MPTNLKSSAPHIANASRWDEGLKDWGGHLYPIDGKSMNTGRLLWKGENGLPEAGVWVCTPGSWRLTLARDELCHFVSGRAAYTSDEGEVIDIRPGTVVHFPGGWTGAVVVYETMRSVYMLR